MILNMYNCEKFSVDLSSEIAVLEIQPTEIFKSVIHDLKFAELPARECAIFYNDKQITASEIILLNDFINPDWQNKTLLTKIYKHLDNEIKFKIESFDLYQKSLHNLKTAVFDLISDVNIDFKSDDEIDIKSIFSVFGIKPIFDNDNLLESLLQFLNVVAELKLYKVIALVHVKSYLNNEELAILYNHALHCQIGLILLESNHAEKMISNEKKLFIDSDFCDIVYTSNH